MGLHAPHIVCSRRPPSTRFPPHHSLKGGTDERIVAGTINFVKGDNFYGRYWGSFEFVNHLHFEVCYYKAIEYCIENGIRYMEPGTRLVLHPLAVPWLNRLPQGQEEGNLSICAGLTLT